MVITKMCIHSITYVNQEGLLSCYLSEHILLQRIEW